MNDLTFLRKHEVMTVYGLLLKTFGGTSDIGQTTDLDYALASVESRAEDDGADLAACAAAYAFHLSHINTFADRGKLVAAAVTELFIEVNGSRLAANDDELLELFRGIGKGDVSRADVENRFREWIG